MTLWKLAEKSFLQRTVVTGCIITYKENQQQKDHEYVHNYLVSTLNSHRLWTNEAGRKEHDSETLARVSIR